MCKCAFNTPLNRSTVLTTKSPLSRGESQKIEILYIKLGLRRLKNTHFHDSKPPPSPPPAGDGWLSPSVREIKGEAQLFEIPEH